MALTPAQRELRRDHRSRLDAARVLVDLEEAAFHTDLPLLDWTVSVAGLVGRPQPTADPDERQAAFDAWTAHLKAEVSDPVERSWPTPCRVLTAQARVPHPQASTGTVRVTLTAEVEPEAGTGIRSAVDQDWRRLLATESIPHQDGDADYVTELLTEGLAEVPDNAPRELLRHSAIYEAVNMLANRYAHHRGFAATEGDTDVDGPRWDDAYGRGERVVKALLNRIRPGIEELSR